VTGDGAFAPPPALARTAALLKPPARTVLETDGAPNGWLELLGEVRPESPGLGHDLMFSSLLPKVYENWWRPAWGRLAKGLFGAGMADEKRIARLMLGLSPGDGVLDVACGTGGFTREFGRVVGPDGLVIGFDASPTMLTRAVADTSSADIGYVRGDVLEMPFVDESFDAVCCFAALNLFARPMAALDEMTRVLTPGGRIAIFTSVGGRTKPFNLLADAIAAQSGIHVFGRRELVDALEDRGYVEIRQRIAGVTQFVGGRLDA
jgi:ubiquinone/menaquinone biosynthesis C-methylase UbiE